MTTQERISKLQGLLARIQRNAEQPRGAHAAVMAPPPVATPIALAPAAAPPTPVPPPVSAADQSVDDLLGVSAQPSEPPLDVDVSLESFPPPAVEAAPLETGEAEPIPLVSVATAQPPAAPTPPPPFDDTFALDSEVSEVRVTTGLREPAVEVTVAAIEAEAEPLGTEELSEDDLVEVTEEAPAPAAAASDLDIDFVDEDEQPPASSQRSKVATSMDEALAAAAAQLDAEREVPIKTPPPESGPQEAPPQQVMSAPPAPDVDALLGGELEIPTRESSAVSPTPEQLGQTIELEEPRGPSLELAEPPAAIAAPAAAEELEVALPGRDVSGGYDDNLMPPPEARDDLEAHRRRLEDDIPPPPESLAQLPSMQPGPEILPLEAAPAAASADREPEVVARPIPAGTPQSFRSSREAFSPRSFSELLDASLALDGD